MIHDQHDHGASHNHDHAPAGFGKAFAVGIALNTAFVAAETTYGYLGNSVALLADAGHNLGDVLGLCVAWLASELVKRKPTDRFTFGLRGSSILAALFNAVFLLVTVGAIAWEAVQRLGSPQPVAERTVMLVGAAILLTGWVWLDPVASLAISAIIVMGTWRLLRESLGMSMAAVPGHIDPAALRTFLASRAGVAGVHDLHVWPMSTTEIAMTCHLVMPAGHPGDAFLHDLAHELSDRFRINHPNVQIEVDAHLACAFAPDDVV